MYWKDDGWFIERFVDYTQVATQGETFEELEENLCDLFQELVLNNVPHQYQAKELNV
jgi:predicted RNase H-like HicB family nuclease